MRAHTDTNVVKATKEEKTPGIQFLFLWGRVNTMTGGAPSLFEFAPENRIIKNTLTGLESILIEQV